MTDNNELTKDDIVIDPEIEVDAEDPNGISVYIETWFDVDEKFGINTKADDSEWLNMYATYNPSEDKLKIDCVVSSDTKYEEFEYTPTENEAQLIKDMIGETTRNYFGCTPQEFVEEFSDDFTIGGI